MPVKWTYCGERRFDVLSGVWNDDRLGITLAEEGAQEIVE